MVVNQNHIMMRQEHYKDLLREAERERLVRQTLGERERGDRFHCRVLGWLGRQMVMWGKYLQERYSNVSSVPKPMATQSR